MKNYVHLSGLLPALLLCLQGYGNAAVPAAPTAQPAVESPAQPTVLDCRADQVAFYEELLLEGEEQAEIIAARGTGLLVSVFENYGIDSPFFREEGYQSFTKRMVLFDTQQGILSSWEVPPNSLCTSGVLLEDRAAYAVIYMNPESIFTTYSIFLWEEGGQPRELASGQCDTTYATPWMTPLGEHVFAYSYCHEDTKEFGVNVVSGDETISRQLAFTEEGSTQHLRTDLEGDGSKYIYYAAVDGVRTIFVGGPTGLIAEFPLPATERVFDYCFLKDSVFFTMEVSDPTGDAPKRKAIVKDFDGNNLMELPCEAFYRLESNGENLVLGIDQHYSVYCMLVSESEMIFQGLDLPRDAVRLYHIRDSELLAHYYYILDILAEMDVQLLRLEITY